MQPSDPIVLATVKQALEEDIGSGDITALLLPPDVEVSAVMFSREPMLVCGCPWVEAVFSMVDKAINVEWQVEEGSWLSSPALLCHVRGSARHILTAERTALNFMQTLSATASMTYHYLQKLNGYSTRLLDTRKTLPGLREAQKYAVACAGGVNHRHGLYDAFLIKENHIAACGSIKKAVEHARALSTGLLVEVEVETLEELREALDAKPDRVLLDNFSLEAMHRAVAMNAPKHCELEASGGIQLETIEQVAATGVDYISVGEITKSIRAIDLSLLVKETRCRPK